MAKAKKKASKATKKAPAAKKKASNGAKKAAKKAPAANKKASARPKKAASRRVALTTDQRKALLPGRDGWQDIADDVARAMTTTGLRVDGVSAGRIVSLTSRAQKAAQREEILLEKQAAALTPVQDARRLAVDQAWRALLEVAATVRFKARRDPALLDQFAPLIDLMKNEPSAREPSEPGAAG